MYFALHMDISNKTLIIRFSSIGDILLASPLLRVLRKRLPSSQIDFVIRKDYADLVRYNPNLNHIYELDAQGGFKELQKLKEKVRSENYDLIIDIHNSLRSRYIRFFSGAKNIVVINKRICLRTILVKFKKNFYRNIISVADRYIEPVESYNIKNDEQGLDLYISNEIISQVSERLRLFKLQRDENVIGFCPSAKHATKRWPAERFIEVGIRLVDEQRAKIFLFGGVNDTVLCSSIADGINKKFNVEQAVNFSGQVTLLETAALMRYCDIVITNDSGLMHLAAAMKKKLVAIFGSTVREFGFFPTGTDHIVVERKGLYCRPCSPIGRRICPEGHFRCMNEIQVEDVLTSVRSIALKK
jgi:lipopolysaccharide heptosyltransferase II